MSDEKIIQVIAEAIVWNRQRRQQQSGAAPLDAADNPIEAEPVAREIVTRLASAGYKIVPMST
jgi:hypothetical protein